MNLIMKHLFSTFILMLLLSGIIKAEDKIAATFTVNTTADTDDANVGDGICADANGDCSFRAAVREASQDPSLVNIAFSIPGAGPHVIALTGALPGFNGPMNIDGATQGSTAGNLQVGTTTSGTGWDQQIVIDGSAVTSGNVFIMNSNTAGSVIRNLCFKGTPSNIIFFSANAGGALIENNFFNTDPAGTAAMGTSNQCIYIRNGTSDVTIRNNVFNSFVYAGVYIFKFTGETGTNSNITIEDNFFGTDKSGMNVIGGNGTSSMAVRMQTPYSNLQVTGNLVTSCDRGIYLVNNSGDVGTGALVDNNYVGINAMAQSVTGSGNTSAGISVTGNSISNIDVTNNIAGNNGNEGLYLFGNTLNALNNFVGTNPSGDVMGNGSSGIYVVSSSGVVVRNNDVRNNSSNGIFINVSSNVTIEQNIVENNSFDGISVGSSNTVTIRNENPEFNGRYGVYVATSDGVTMTDVTTNDNSIGTYLTTVSNFSITNLTSNRSTGGTGYGLAMDRCSAGTVTNLVADNNSYIGLNILGCDNIDFTTLRFTANSSQGMAINWSSGTGKDSEFLTFEDVIINDSGQVGIRVLHENCHDIDFNNCHIYNSGSYNYFNAGNNITFSNGTLDSAGPAQANAYFLGQGNSITDSKIMNGQLGIHVAGIGTDLLIQNDTIYDNASVGIYVGSGDNIVVLNNSIYNNGSKGILLSGTSNSSMPIPEIIAFDASSVTGWMEGFEPNTDYLIQYYTTDGLAENDGEGANFVADYTVTTDLDGNVLFTHPITIPPGEFPRFTTTQLE